MALHHSFAGKKVLITGGGRGIGRTLVKRLHSDGAIVYTVDKDPSSLQTLKAECPTVHTAIVDLSDWNATKNTIENFGVTFDHLVNNAGIAQPVAPFLEIQPDGLKKIFDVNLFSMVNVGQLVSKGMIASGNGGTIVNLASIAGVMTVPEICAYSMTKAAIIMLTKSMALELGDKNIRVNCICPTGVDTPLVGELPAAAGPALARAAIKRPVTTDEAADLIFYLLSPRSAMITGEKVLIDGGVMIC